MEVTKRVMFRIDGLVRGALSTSCLIQQHSGEFLNQATVRHGSPTLTQLDFYLTADNSEGQPSRSRSALVSEPPITDRGRFWPLVHPDSTDGREIGRES